MLQRALGQLHRAQHLGDGKAQHLATGPDQEELDHYWERLGEGGDPAAQVCGWLKDKYGLSWQVVPDGIDDLMNDPDEAKAAKAFAAMLQMKKVDIAELYRAADQT